MCKVCDKQRQFAEMVVDCLRRPDPDMNTFRALEQSVVIAGEWRALVRRAIELCSAAEVKISGAARRVVQAINLDKLWRDVEEKRGQLDTVNMQPASVEIGRGTTILSELGQDDPFRNKGRFEEINAPLWSRYFAHEREQGLRPDIVGWIEGFCNRYYRPVIDQLVSMLTHRSFDVRGGVAAVIEGIQIPSLLSDAGLALAQRLEVVEVGATNLILPSQFSDAEWERVLLETGTGEHEHDHGSGLKVLSLLAHN